MATAPVWSERRLLAIALRAIGLLRRGGRAAAENPDLPTSPEVLDEERAP